MVTILKGQAAGKSEQVVFLSTPSTASASLIRELFEAHRRKVGNGFGVPRRMLGRDRMLTSVFPAAAVPSFHVLGGRLELADIAALDAVEGRARCERPQQVRFGK